MASYNTETFINGFPKHFERIPEAVLPHYTETDPELIPDILGRLAATWKTGKTRPIKYRKQQLTALFNGIIAEAPLIVEALARDFKAVFEAAFEVQVALAELKDFLENMDSWLAPVNVSRPISVIMDSTKYVYEPYGVILGISPWNFPFSLAMVPAIGAIATGNCFVFKPSEMSPNTSAMISLLVSKYLDPSCISIINGGVEVTTKALELRWDFISYTGSGTVGRIVMAAAAKHLTPTLLELGGKSPAYIDDTTCDLRIAARRIVWAKFYNAGQLCITVDYIICRPCIKEKLEEILKEEIISFYTTETENNPNWPRIVNERHAQRIVNNIPTKTSPTGFGRVVYGGDHKVSERYIQPTIITDVDPNCAPIMQSEIFGPVLPIITLEDEDEAIEYIISKDKPLAFYLFSDDSRLIEKMTAQISSGGVCINDTLMHHNVNTLPFGGVGESGMGSCHGCHSIAQFSHKKSVYQANNYRQMENVMKVRYPGSKLCEALPILFPHNLYSYLPESSLITRVSNSILSSARLTCRVASLLLSDSKDSSDE